MSPNSSCESSENHSTDQTADKQDGWKRALLPKKVYTDRNSVLTDLMMVKHLQTVYNIGVSVFFLLLINACIYYIAAPKMFWEDTKIILWAAGNLTFFLQMWLSFNLFAYAVFRGFIYWVRLRNVINSKLVDATFIFLYLLAIVCMFTATTLEMMRHEFRPITNFSITCEQVRIFMKIYSFVRENVPRVLQYKLAKDGNQEHALCPSFKHFLYFLFAPALVYRDTYPQKEAISWRFVGHKLFKFFACIFITYCIFMRFMVDIFRNTGIQQFTLEQASLIFAGGMVVGSMMMFLMFYGMLHSWLNVFAELMKFGDREFYQDWWNSTSFSQYYRKWNTVVHDWLYTYVYMDSNKIGFNRSASLLFVFFVSALVHEYIIALSLGFFFPVLMVMYSTIGVVMLFLTKKRTAQFWNTFMWCMLFSGWGVIVCLYALEWYARVNCKASAVSSMDFFTPRLLDPSCHIISYS